MKGYQEFSKKYFLLGKYFSEKLIFFGKLNNKQKTAPMADAVGFCVSVDLISKKAVHLNSYLDG